VTVPDEAKQGLRKHYREMRWQVWMPFAGAVLLTALLGLLLVVLRDEGTLARANAMASLALIAACLLPGIVVALILFVVLVALVVGMNYVHRMTIPPLQRVEQVAYQARMKVDGWAQRANQSALRWGSFLAPLDQFFERLDQFLKEQQHDREQR
jgi:ABC-type methionine transport system permease subunit